MEDKDKAALVAAAKEIVGKQFPAEKYFEWRTRFATTTPATLADGFISYACEHSEVPSERELIKMKLADFRQPLCPECRASAFEKIQRRAASKEAAKNLLGLYWPKK